MPFSLKNNKNKTGYNLAQPGSLDSPNLWANLDKQTTSKWLGTSFIGNLTS